MYVSLTPMAYSVVGTFIVVGTKIPELSIIDVNVVEVVR